MELLVFERKSEGVGLQDKVERIDVERLDFEFGTDTQGVGTLPKMRPGEKVVVRVARPDEFGIGRNIEGEILQSHERVFPRPHVEEVRRKRDLAIIFIAREVGNVDLHSRSA